LLPGPAEDERGADLLGVREEEEVEEEGVPAREEGLAALDLIGT
jgi:rhodanese-related sulfurtransferase